MAGCRDAVECFWAGEGDEEDVWVREGKGYCVGGGGGKGWCHFWFLMVFGLRYGLIGCRGELREGGRVGDRSGVVIRVGGYLWMGSLIDAEVRSDVILLKLECGDDGLPLDWFCC